MAERRIVRRPRTESSGTRRQDWGVPENASVAVRSALLLYDKGTDQPFCTCSGSYQSGYGFDPQMGVFVHADPKCWKPSKGYYEAALRAGVLADLTKE